MRPIQNLVLASLAAAVALLGTALGPESVRSDASPALPAAASDSLVLDGHVVRAEAQLWVDRMLPLVDGCGSGPHRDAFLVMKLTSTGSWPAGLEPVRLWAVVEGRVSSDPATWQYRRDSGGAVTLRGIPEAWTTLDAVLEPRGPAGSLWLAVRAVEQQIVV